MQTKKIVMPEADLESLYFQVQEWIKETDFHIEELHFLRELVDNKIGNNTFEGQDHKHIYRHIDTVLEALSNEAKAVLNNHEGGLFAAIGKKNKTDAVTLNEAHEGIVKKMSVLKEGIRALKKSIFSYVKNDPFGEADKVYWEY